MAGKAEEVRFASPHSVQAIGRELQGIFASLKAGSVEPLQSTSGALAAFDDSADIEIVASGASFTSMWAVQVYVWDYEDYREVAVVALGDGGLTRAMVGARYTTSLGNSIRKRDQVALRLGYEPPVRETERFPENSYEEAPTASPAPSPVTISAPPPPPAPNVIPPAQIPLREFVEAAGFEAITPEMYKGTYLVDDDRSQVLWVSFSDTVSLISPIADGIGEPLPEWLTNNDFGRYTVKSFATWAVIQLDLPLSTSEDTLRQEALIIAQYADTWENAISPGNDAL